MKNSTQLIVLALSLTLLTVNSSAQNVGINSTGSTPNTKALLDMDAAPSNNKGLLIPRLTTVQRNTIAAPIPESLLIYNTTTQCFEAWNQTTTTWVAFGCIGGCNVLPTTANAGLDITPACGITTATLAGNTPTVGIGAWSVVSGTATITTPSSPTSGVTGLAVPGTVTLQWTISNPPCTPSTDVVVITTSSCVSCGQVFAAANLNAGTQVNSTAAGSQQPSPYNLKYCYNNVAANCAIYGGLYEWDDVMLGAASVNCDPCGSSGVQGMCPAGYHIPTDLEWSRYEYCIENNIAPTGTTTLATFQTTAGWRGSTTAGVGPGAKMKVTSSNTPAWDGTNTSGFAALPAGYRLYADGAFYFLGTHAYYWSATEYSSTYAWSRILATGNVQSYRSNNFKTYGFSVRCLQN